MPKLVELARKIRSKNAGPFWITVDIFCGDNFDFIRSRLYVSAICNLLGCNASTLKHFEITELKVIKISVVRQAPQGSREDRDMHGAQIAALFTEMEI
ncbi:DUF4387 family protein [Alphaproteobacteria bacterium LSUCC0684]